MKFRCHIHQEAEIAAELRLSMGKKEKDDPASTVRDGGSGSSSGSSPEQVVKSSHLLLMAAFPLLSKGKPFVPLLISCVLKP